MVSMPFILAFMFQVMHILVFRKKKQFGNGAGLFLATKNRGFLTPVVWILDGVMK